MWCKAHLLWIAGNWASGWGENSIKLTVQIMISLWILFVYRTWELALKIINMFSNSSEGKCSVSQHIEKVVKTFLYTVAFIFITSARLLIPRIVWKCFQIKRKLNIFLLCSHLLCCSVFCDLGAVCYTAQILDVRTPQLVICVTFGVQVASGRRPFTLMALNQCLAPYADLCNIYHWCTPWNTKLSFVLVL